MECCSLPYKTAIILKTNSQYGLVGIKYMFTIFQRQWKWAQSFRKYLGILLTPLRQNYLSRNALNMWVSLMAQRVKNPPVMHETLETLDRSLGPKSPWRRKRQATPVSLPGKSHRERTLTGYSPKDRKEAETAE